MFPNRAENKKCLKPQTSSPFFQGFGETHHPKVSHPPIFLKGGNDFQDFQGFG